VAAKERSFKKGRLSVFPGLTRAILASIANIPSEFQTRQPHADQWTESKGRRINEAGGKRERKREREARPRTRQMR